MDPLLYICCTLAIERVVLLFNPLLLVKPNADALVTFATHVMHDVHTYSIYTVILRRCMCVSFTKWCVWHCEIRSGHAFIVASLHVSVSILW